MWHKQRSDKKGIFYYMCQKQCCDKTSYSSTCGTYTSVAKRSYSIIHMWNIYLCSEKGHILLYICGTNNTVPKMSYYTVYMWHKHTVPKMSYYIVCGTNTLCQKCHIILYVAQILHFCYRWDKCYGEAVGEKLHHLEKSFFLIFNPKCLKVAIHVTPGK
jgi:hypothetical protein